MPGTRNGTKSKKDNSVDTPLDSVSEPTKTKRGPGRPRKNDTAAASIAQPELTPLTEPQSGGHTTSKPKAKANKRKSSSAASETNHNVIAEDDPLPLADKPAKKPRVVKNPPPRSPLPDRISRIQSPGGPDKPRVKRTPAQVKAAKAESDRLKQEIAELEKQKIERLAQLELDEEEEDAEEDQNVVRTLDDIREDGSGESFDFAEINEMGTTEEDSDKETEGSGEKKKREKPVVKATKKGPETSKAKGGPGKTREAVDAHKEVLRLKRKATNINEGRSGSKRPKVTAPPSGLIPHWRDKAPEAKTLRKDAPENTGEALGGLTDTHAEADPPSESDQLEVAPTFLPKAKMKSRQQSSNVKILSSEDEVEDVVSQNPLRAKARLPHSPIKPPSTVTKTTTNPRSGKNQSKNESKLVKVEADQKTHVGLSNGNKPTFMEAAWSKTFLPTIYFMLGTADKPFEHFSKGPEVMVALQEAIDLVWVGTTYRITWQEKGCLTAIDRLNEKRSWFGSRALELVKNIFNKGNFHENPTAIAEYAKWATRGDGPAIYGKPAAMELSVNDSNYVPPQGVFESGLVKTIMTTFLVSTKNSRLTSGRPKGALALTVTAIERAFTAFHSGIKIAPADFSRDHYSCAVADYMSQIEMMSERRWDSLMAQWGQPATAATTAESSAGAQHRQLFMGSSPTKLV